MSGLRKPQLFSIEDYLQGEQQADLRHEFVDGQVFAIAGASARHNRICIRALMALEPLALAKGCQSFMADMKLRVGNSVYYPDIMVVCDSSDSDALMKSAPCLIIEVLSESTERADQIEKLQAYQTILTLRNYLLLTPRRRVARTPLDRGGVQITRGKVAAACGLKKRFHRTACATAMPRI